MSESFEMPDINSPEFRGFLYNKMLERIEHLDKADALVRMLLDERTPGALVRMPEMWYQIRSAANSQRLVNAYCRDIFAAAGEVMDDKSTYEAVGEFTAGQIKKNHESSG